MASVLDGTVPLQRASISGGVAGQMNYQTMKFGTKFRLSGFGTKHPVPIEDAFDHYFGTTQSIMADLTKTFKDYFAFVKSSRKEDMVHQKRGGLWGTIRGFAPHFFDFKIWKKITGHAADPQIDALHQIRDFLINRFSKDGELETNKRLYGRDPKDMFMAIIDQWGFERRRLASKGEEKAGPFATIYRFMKEAYGEGQIEKNKDLKAKYGASAWDIAKKEKGQEKRKAGFWDKMMKSGVGKAFMGFGSVASAKQMKSALPVVISEDISTATKKEAALLEETRNAQVQETKETKKANKDVKKGFDIKKLMGQLAIFGFSGLLFGFLLKGLFGSNGLIGKGLSFLFSKMGPVGEALDKVFGQDGFMSKTIGAFFDKNGPLFGLLSGLFLVIAPRLIWQGIKSLFGLAKFGITKAAPWLGKKALKYGLPLAKGAARFAGPALGALMFAAESAGEYRKSGGGGDQFKSGNIGGGIGTTLFGGGPGSKNQRSRAGAVTSQGLKYAMLGAGIGVVGGPLGMAIGGIIGAGVGAVGGAIKQKIDRDGFQKENLIKGVFQSSEGKEAWNRLQSQLNKSGVSITEGLSLVLKTQTDNMMNSKEFKAMKEKGFGANKETERFLDKYSFGNTRARKSLKDAYDSYKYGDLKDAKFSIDEYETIITDDLRKKYKKESEQDIKARVISVMETTGISELIKNVDAGVSVQSILAKYSGGIVNSEQSVKDYEHLKNVFNPNNEQEMAALEKVKKSADFWLEKQKELEKKEGGWNLMLNAMSLAADGIVTLIDVTKNKKAIDLAKKESTPKTADAQVK
jgi:hypothetical protein